jgi:hypothetical protein
VTRRLNSCAPPEFSRLLLLLALLAGCAATGAGSSTARLAQLEHQAPDCPSFAELDGRVQTESDQLVASAPSEALISGAAALGRARRACARHVLGRLLELRELQGISAVQAELDALARAFTREDLDGLLAAAVGGDANALRPLVAEAYAHHRGEGRTSATAPPPQPHEEQLLCAELSEPCAAATCLAEHRAAAELSARSRACLDALRTDAPARRAQVTARLIEALRPAGASGVLTEALLTLETLRRQLWPEVLAAKDGGQPLLAAQLAAPFAVLDSSREEVGRLRTQGIAFHLELARGAAPRALAARLHRLVAARAGGPAEPPLQGEPGHWSTARWGCAWTAPSLPTPFQDVELRLLATCRKAAAAKRPRPEPGALSTFELEKSLEQELVEGSVSATCAGRTFRKPFSVRALLFDASDTGRAEALLDELRALVAGAERDCRELRAAQARASCDELATLSSADAEQRYAEAFVATGRWEPCFVAHFTRRYGVGPPMPEPAEATDFTLQSK